MSAEQGIELLYVDGCPHLDPLAARVRALVPAEELALRRIGSPDSATAARFLGSPTLRVDGRDVERGAERRTDYGLKCRLYRTPDGLTGMPSDEAIRAALARRDR